MESLIDFLATPPSGFLPLVDMQPIASLDILKSFALLQVMFQALFFNFSNYNSINSFF